MSAPIKAQTEEATVIETIAVLGAGRVGSAIARTALAAGFRVNIASSGPAADIEMLVDVVVPGANAMAAAEAVADADLVILAIPLPTYRPVPQGMLDGNLAIATLNYWPPPAGAPAACGKQLTATESTEER